MTDKERKTIIEKDFADEFPMMRELKTEKTYWGIRELLLGLFYYFNPHEHPAEYAEAQEAWNREYSTASENKKIVMLDLLNEWKTVKKGW